MSALCTNALVALVDCLARLAGPVNQLVLIHAGFVPAGSLVYRTISFENILPAPATLARLIGCVKGWLGWFSMFRHTPYLEGRPLRVVLDELVSTGSVLQESL